MPGLIQYYPYYLVGSLQVLHVGHKRGWAIWSIETKRMGVCSGWGLEGLHISESSRWSSHLSLISLIRPGYGVIKMVVWWVAMDAGNNQTKDFPWPVAMWMAKLVVF